MNLNEGREIERCECGRPYAPLVDITGLPALFPSRLRQIGGPCLECRRRITGYYMALYTDVEGEGGYDDGTIPWGSGYETIGTIRKRTAK